jgi:hypothetical protein
MTAVAVETDAALELLELAAREIRKAIEELGLSVTPHSLLFLAGRLDWACEQGVNVLAVRLAREAAYRARRCDLRDAFIRLNPTFAVRIHDGCWAGTVDVGDRDRERQRRAQRHELELSMGDRFAKMLVPEATS